MQRFTRFTFSTLWSQNCQLRHLFKVMNLTTFPTASGTFENSIKGQLAARELPRTRALLEDFYGATGHGKDLKIGSAAFLFKLSLPLCLCVFEASRDLCVATTVKKCANPPRGRTEKTWLWFAASNQNATVITNQIPSLSSVRVRQTNNECAQAYLPLCSPFSTLGPSSFPSACNHFWLALTLCQYHHPRWRQSSFPWLVISSIYEKWAQK